jgi:gliding motility-associated-like protein
VKRLLALLLVFVCLSGKSQNISHKNPKTLHGEAFLDYAKGLYDWHDVENAFAKKLKITTGQTNAFFSFAYGKGHLSMSEYLKLVRDGSVTKTNALQYWLDKLPLFEKVYSEDYLPFSLNNANNTSAKQGNNAVSSGGANCNNLDFSTGTTAGWAGKWNDLGGIMGAGSTYGTLAATGFNSSGTNSMGYVHQICTGGNDPNVPVTRVPPGHSYSLRLGDDSAYRIDVTSGNNPMSLPFNHQIVSNTFMVTQANQAVTYWYAVVLCQYNPNNHVAGDQPYFKIRMYNASGNEITCAHYDVDALSAPTIGGFLLDSTSFADSSSAPPTMISYGFFYKDWSQVMIPLTNYIGQNVTLTFETSDCAHGGHPGYAYVEADCAPFPGITFTPFVCGMNTTTLTAPPGVATYSWTGPAIVGTHTAQTVTVSAGGTYSVTMTTIGNGGVSCTLSLDTFLQGVPPTPVATFTTLPVCVGNPTVFGGLAPGVYNHIMWNFGDGGKDSSNTAPTHTYASPGTYTVSLFVDNGCTDTYTTTVTVNPGATSSFNAAPVCRGTPTVFNNTSTGGASYEWNFGDGSTHSTAQSPTHTYANSGNFVVTLTVTNTWGCKFLSTNTVVVNVMPVAQFSAPITCLGQSTTFNNTTTPATNVIYHWDFGVITLTNDTSNIQNPSYTYNTIGTYTVLLQVSTTAGCSSSVTHTVTVNPVPSMTLTTPPPYCWNDNVPQTTYTTTPVNPAMTFGWTNSNAQIGLGGAGSGIPPAFTAGLNNTTANISGVITVVPTLNGCTGPPATFTITVKPTPFVSHTSVDYCPKVVTNALTFTASPAGSSITWINTTPGVNIGLSTTNGTTTLPSFNAVDPGNSMMSNIISLQAVLNGCTGPLTTFSININPNPVANFTNTPACDGAGTSFIDLSTIGSGTLSSWAWDMNNDGIYTDAAIKNPSYILTPVGNHTVNLAVTSNKGCMDTVSEVVYVNPRPVVNFKGDSLSGCNPLSVNFTDSCYVQGPDVIVKWIWDFGNGTTLTDTTSAMVMNTFLDTLHASTKFYNISLTAVTNMGCATKLIKPNYITVFPIPLAGFSWGPNDVDILDPTVKFHDESLGANYYNWNFGDMFNTDSDNDTSSLVNPKHIYSDQFPYTYYATQIVTNIYGCKDTIVEPVIIKPAVTFYAPNAFTPNYDGTNDGFKGTGIGIDNSTYNLWVYDRWGMELFHSNDLEETWNGKFKGVLCQEDTYVWKVTFSDITRTEHAYKGIVSIIR